MSDGAIGKSHVTIPDLLEPVVGFRTFKVTGGQPAREAWDELKWSNNPYGEPFKEPNEFVTDPATGQLIKNYNKIAEAFEKWQASLGTSTTIHHEATPAILPTLVSPQYADWEWSAEKNTAKCIGSHLEAAPYGACNCGLYSYYDAEQCTPGGFSIMGIVTSWGRIEAHATGMRSQFMEIHALWGGDAMKLLGPEWDGVLKFWVGEVDRKEFASLASEFGSPIPETMRPLEVEVEEDYPIYTSSKHYIPAAYADLYRRDLVNFDEADVYRYYMGKRRRNPLYPVFKNWKWFTWWLMCLVLLTNGLWARPLIPLFAGDPAPVRSPQTAPYSPRDSIRNVFKAPLSAPRNSLVYHDRR